MNEKTQEAKRERGWERWILFAITIMSLTVAVTRDWTSSTNEISYQKSRIDKIEAAIESLTEDIQKSKIEDATLQGDIRAINDKLDSLTEMMQRILAKGNRK